MQGEIYACALTSVYTFGPTFRAENSHTTRQINKKRQHFVFSEKSRVYHLKRALCIILKEPYVLSDVGLHLWPHSPRRKIPHHQANQHTEIKSVSSEKSPTYFLLTTARFIPCTEPGALRSFACFFCLVYSSCLEQKTFFVFSEKSPMYCTIWKEPCESPAKILATLHILVQIFRAENSPKHINFQKQK